MKKIFYFILALALSTGNAMAFEFENEPQAGLSFMGLFGMNISKLQNSNYGAKAGAMLGVRADYVLPKAHGLYLTAGLDWTMKGSKTSFIVSDIENIEGTLKYALHYIEIPVRVGFRYNLMDNLGFYGEIGPYFAVGVGGRHKCSIDADGQDVRDDEDALTYKAFKNEDFDPTNPGKLTFQRWDAGISFRIGAEYEKRYNLIIGADWGLADIYRTSLRDSFSDYYRNDPSWTGPIPVLPKVKNFNFSIAVGYRF